MEPKEYIVKSEDKLPETIELIFKDLKHKLILMVGDLGAGKTTTVKAILNFLECEDIGSSPSYSLINEYKTPSGPLYHIDLYRLEEAEEAFNIAIEDYLYSNCFCFIEWPQIIFDYIEEPYHILKIEIIENNARKISII